MRAAVFHGAFDIQVEQIPDVVRLQTLPVTRILVSIAHFGRTREAVCSRPQGFPMLGKKGMAKGEPPFAGARGVLAASSSPSRRRRQKGALESPALHLQNYRHLSQILAYYTQAK